MSNYEIIDRNNNEIINSDDISINNEIELQNDTVDDNYYQYCQNQATKPEHILFLIDTCSEMDQQFDVNNSQSTLEVLLQVLKSFVWRKSASLFGHKIAIASYEYNGNITSYYTFCSDYEIILQNLSNILNQHCSNDNTIESFDINELFNQLYIKLNESDFMVDNNVRCILIYGNSYCLPQLTNNIHMFKLRNFFCDVLYIHMKANIDGVLCQEIYNILSDIELYQQPKNIYILETHLVLSKLYTLVTALLAHSFQRQIQSDFINKLDYKED